MGLTDSPLFSFKPLPWQAGFLRSTAKVSCAIGANRSGKTECGAYRGACRLKGFDPVTGELYKKARNGGPTKGWAVALDYPNSVIMMEKLERYLGINGVDFTYKSSDKLYTDLHTGNQCWIKSTDSGREKFQAQDLDWVWFDEEPPFAIFKEAWTRTIDRAGRIFMTLTPLKGSAWLYQRVYASADPLFEIFTMSMYDNKYLPRTEIENAKSIYHDEAEIAVRIKGEFRMFGRPVLHIASVDEIKKRHIRPPSFRGRLTYRVAQ